MLVHGCRLGKLVIGYVAQAPVFSRLKARARRWINMHAIRFPTPTTDRSRAGSSRERRVRIVYVLGGVEGFRLLC